MTALAVFIGGGLGAMTRWGATVGGARAWPGAALPWATLGVNLAGSFVLGLLVPIFARQPSWPPAVRAGVTAGVLGGLTTFSTFSVESISAWRVAPALGLLNLALNIGLGLAAAAAGLWCGGRLA